MSLSFQTPFHTMLCLYFMKELSCNSQLPIYMTSVTSLNEESFLFLVHALLFQANRPISFWSFVVTHVIHIINLLPSSKQNNLSPFSFSMTNRHTYLIFEYLVVHVTHQHL
ncbi:hypothetical protein CR513_62045, partial [Mucuna pruriens]